MRLPPLHEARFVRRLNRFAATVSLNGREVKVHVANSGRLRELLLPGSLCYLTDQPGSHRKTAYDLSLVAIERPGHESVREPQVPYGTERGPGARHHPRIRRRPPPERARVGGLVRRHVAPL